MSLTALGEAHGTDKLFHGYLPLYEKHLPQDVTSLLEIGVFGGKSLRMWRDRFPGARIYGLDVDPGCQKHATAGIDITIGSQDDPVVLEALAQKAGGFDVVIDDGSHVNELTIASFEALWPHTRRLYVIEDLECSYVNLTPHVAGWPGMGYNRPDLDYRNHRSDMDRFFTRLIRDVDAEKMSLHFYPNIVFMEKL